MADRASGEGDPGVPKEVFELDKDERWQARLDEARARREIALREKAAGKPQKPRPKPWEIEGASLEKPPRIEPIVQERGDDKFDFADRLETIREAKEAARPPEPAPLKPVPDPEKTPPAAADPPSRKPVRRAPAPEVRARPQPSLILPGAPDVADLAARYAATLDKTAPPDPEMSKRDRDAPEPPKRSAELVALPTARRSEEVGEPRLQERLSRAERRRGVRPLGMAFGLLALAALPLTTEAPPLEKGPGMPVIDALRIQPALGVTWSLYERPFQTRAGDWRPGPAPSALGPVTFAPLPPPLLDSVALPPEPDLRGPGGVEWRGPEPVVRSGVPGLAPVIAPQDGLPVVPDAPNPLAVPGGEPVETVVPEPSGGISAPPRPATLQDEPGEAPPPPAARPATETVVESDPLRVTILAPARVDRALAETIASGVQNDGHELVRVRDVDFSISERNVRYFHESDRASAARMAERYDAELRDFTWFRPQPVEGTAELWLAGRAGSGNTSGREQPGPNPIAGGVAERGDFLGRVFDRLGLGTELPPALPGGNDLRSILPPAGESGN